MRAGRKAENGTAAGRGAREGVGLQHWRTTAMSARSAERALTFRQPFNLFEAAQAWMNKAAFLWKDLARCARLVPLYLTAMILAYATLRRHGTHSSTT